MTSDNIEWSYSPPERIVAVGDIHGDFDALVTVLLERKLVNTDGHWIGGETHLVLMGDLVDRYKFSRLVQDYLICLSKEASSSIGRIHTLLGNHDVMIPSGDLRYVTKEEFLSYSNFVSSPYLEKIKEKLNLDKLVQWHSIFDNKDPDRFNPNFGLWIKDNNNIVASVIAAYRGSTKYALFNSSRNSVIKIGSTLFVHGGLGHWAHNVDFGRVNTTIRTWLRFIQAQQNESPPPHTNWVLNSSDSPLWDRRLAFGKLSDNSVSEILRAHKIKRIALGHTVTDSHEIESLYNDQVYLLDTGMSRGIGGKLSALEIKDETVAPVNSIKRTVKSTHPTRAAVEQWVDGC